MLVIETLDEVRARRAGLTGRAGLVPTMGALHGGHLALIEQARADNDSVLATIFVNPAQFGADEDLDDYPRDLQRDLDLLEQAAVDLVFTPTREMMYPPGYQTYVMVEEVTRVLEGEHRPKHFRGVTTIVAKLFNLMRPDAAYFGQKDAQQVVVIRRMVRDLNFPPDIVVCPTVREDDGLALSSRNRHLNGEERRAATVLYGALRAAGKAYSNGERDPELLRAVMMQVLWDEPLVEADYVSLADVRTLKECDEVGDAPVLASLAARVGETRLIDNMLLPAKLNNRDDLTVLLGAV